VSGELAAGDIVFLHFQAIRPTPKEKFAVVCAIDPKPILVLINSDVNRFFSRSAESLAHHVPITSRDHPCLSYDSFVDCTSYFGYDLADLIAILEAEPARLKGVVTADVRTKISACVASSRLWPPKKAKLVVEALGRPETFAF